MATILRSSKYVRNFVEFTTKLGFSQIQCHTRMSLISHRPSSLSSTFVKSLATQAAPKNLNDVSKLETTIQRLDTDIKRNGKISSTKLQRVLNTFQNSDSVTSTQALMLIRCCGNLVFDELPEVRSNLVNQLWQSLENSGIELNLTHYNALLRVYIENEYAFSPTEILTELERKGIEPNKLTYQRLINRYCQQGDIEGATKILEFMTKKEISINETIFTALVRGHSETGDMVSALDILSVMRQAGLEPTPDTYKELLCGYAKQGDMESITNTLSECKTKNIHLLDADFLDVVYSLASNGHDEHIPGIIQLMPKSYGYTVDALKHVVKLVKLGKFDISMQILTSIPARTAGGQTGFQMIKQLTAADLPVAQLIDICNEIKSRGIHFQALLIALESYLVQGNIEGSLGVLNVLKESNTEIREHYFWPIFIALGRSNDNAGIVNLVKAMRSEYLVMVSGETLRDYVVPNITGESDEVFSELCLTGLPDESVANAIAYNLILKMKLEEAVNFVANKNCYVPENLFARPLVVALMHTNDVTSFVKILFHFAEKTSRSNETFSEGPVIPIRSHVFDHFITKVATQSKGSKPEILQKVVEELYAKGGCISDYAITTLKQMSERQIINIINKLQNGDANGRRTGYHNPENFKSEIAELENSLQTLNSGDEPVVNIKQRLLHLYCTAGDLANIDKIIMEFEASGVELPQKLIQPLINAYFNAGALDKVEKYLQTDRVSEWGDGKIIKYITLLITNDRLDDAVEFIRTQKDRISKPNTNEKNLWSGLLNALADNGLLEVNTIFDELLKQECISITRLHLAPLVKVHIVRGDLQEALNAFEKACENYQQTPKKNELAKKLIEAEDATALQRLTDLSTQVHGEINSLYDLGQSFIECDCIRQAKKILEIPALAPRIQKLKRTSERYSERGQTVFSERLVSVIKDLPSCKGIPEFYNNLLSCYINENNWEKGINLYKQMLEDEVQPSDVFLANLGKLLQKNDQPIPFKVSESPVINQIQKFRTRNSDRQRVSVNKEVDEFRKWETSQSQPHAVSIDKEESKLIQSMIENQELEIAVRRTEDLFTRNGCPTLATLKLLHVKLAKAGDIESLEKIGEKMSLSLKKILPYENYLYDAYIAAGKFEEYLDLMEKKLESDNVPILQDLNQFPMGSISQLLQRNPEFLERYTKIAEKYVAQGNIQPINALWRYYLFANNPEADKIWSKYLINRDNVNYLNIVRIAQRRNNSELLARLINNLATSTHITDTRKGSIYSILAKSYCDKGKFQESANVFRHALTVVNARDISAKVVEQVQTRLAENGLTLPADILSKLKTIEAREQVEV